MAELGFKDAKDIFTSYPYRAIDCFANEYGGSWVERKIFEEMLKSKGIIVNLPEFANLDERRAFLDSDAFAKITNEYYQTLSDNEKSIFIDALSCKIVSDYIPTPTSKYPDAFKLKYRREGYDIDTPEGMERLKTTAKIFSILEDDSKFDYASPEVLKGALEFSVLQTDSQRLEAIKKIASFDEEKDYIKTYLDEVESESYPKLNLTVEQMEKLKLDNKELTDTLIPYLTDDAKETYLQSDEYRLSTLEGKSFVEVISEYVDAVQSEELELIKGKQKDLELLLKQKGIEAEFTEPTEVPDIEEFLTSDNFKSMVNRYYQSIEDKESFVNETGKNYSYISKARQLGSKIFSAIEDDAKFEYLSYNSINVLGRALENGLLESDSHRLVAISKIYEANPNSQYLGNYFEGVRNGRFGKFEFSPEQIESLIKRKDEVDDKLITAIFSSTNHERVINYLERKPEDVSFCMNTLEPREAYTLLKSIDDEEYKAKLLLSIKEGDAKIIGSLFPNIEDDFVRGMITAKHTDPEFLEVGKSASQRIKDFLEVKKKFLDLPEDERASYLSSLPFDDFENPNSNIHRDVNEMKKSLLSYVENPNDRRSIIESMACYVDPDIEEYVALTQQMIREYVDDNLKLDEAQMERLEMTFRTNDVYFTDYEERRGRRTNGQADHVRKEITIANHSRGDTKNIIVDMIHEYSHALSMTNYMQDAAYHVGHTFEEGMADTFAEQVANYYFSKHKDVEIGGETFQPDLPLISQSSYKKENGLVKSMLYPLSETGQDKAAIQQFVFGDKNKFFNLALGEGYSQRVEHDFAGNPLNVEVTSEDLLSAHPTAFSRIRTGDLYLQKNPLISTLTSMTQSMHTIDEEMPLEGSECISRIEESKIRLGQISAAAYALTQDIEAPKKMRERDDNSRGG